MLSHICATCTSSYLVLFTQHEAQITFSIHNALLLRVLLITKCRGSIVCVPQYFFYLHSSSKRSLTKKAASQRLILVKSSSDTQTLQLQRCFACFAVSTRSSRRILLTLRFFFVFGLYRIYKCRAFYIYIVIFE